ncbi:MAG: small multi-drug export protein [Candidatus Omnitrophica bacterium]|nr:small multi-drug export protein [Candidatus Omnitrophota bacterium]
MGWIFKLPKEAAVLIVGMLPIFELRGAIPLGFYLNLGISQTFFFAIIGNLIPIVPVLFLLKPVSYSLHRFFIFKRFFKWLFEHTRRRTEIIQKYETVGLTIFVAIPLPFTGAWTGAIAASLFKIRFRYAILAITIGVLIAGIIVTFLCILGKLTWQVIR